MKKSFVQSGFQDCGSDKTRHPGASVFKAIDAVRDLGCEVLKVISLVDREQGGREAFAEAGIPYSPIFSISELLAEK